MVEIKDINREYSCIYNFSIFCQEFFCVLCVNVGERNTVFQGILVFQVLFLGSCFEECGFLFGGGEVFQLKEECSKGGKARKSIVRLGLCVFWVVSVASTYDQFLEVFVQFWVSRGFVVFQGMRKIVWKREVYYICIFRFFR